MTMQCPKCHAPMQTYNRNGVQIEQCSGCRGIFLDYGELEALTRLESQWSQPRARLPPPRTAGPRTAAVPGRPRLGRPAPRQHGHHGPWHHGHHKQATRGFGHMLFSS